MRDEIDQKEYENKCKSSQKRTLQTLSHTYKNEKNNFFFSQKRKPFLRQSPEMFYKKAVLHNKSLQHYQKQTPT